MSKEQGVSLPLRLDVKALAGNPRSEGLRRLRRDALEILGRALHAVDPERAVFDALRKEDRSLVVAGHRFPLGRDSSIVLLAAGKAAGSMTRGALRIVRPDYGLIAWDRARPIHSTTGLTSVQASHPLPDRESLAAGKRALRMVEGLEEGDALLVLLSGGASAMLEATAVPLRDLRGAYARLLRSGLYIRDVNEVRKGLSQLKGGRLAEEAAARGALVISLVVSDIIGNPMEDLGSGPTAPTSSRGGRAAAILKRSGLWEAMAESVRRTLRSPERRRWTDRSGRVHAFIVADNEKACRAAKAEAMAFGYQARIFTTSFQGEARQAGPRFVQAAFMSNRPLKKRAAIAGGETTVTVRGRGRGGRNGELALSIVERWHALPAVLVSCGTDGIDGTGDAAGAIVDGESFSRARRLKLEWRRFLGRNDSHSFFQALDDLLVTGPTGTNVGDLQILLFDPSAEPRP